MTACESVPYGKPDAGNPHVAPTPSYGGTGRFDEGEVAPAKPRRGSLLYNKGEFIAGAALCVAAGLWIGGVFAATGGELSPQGILRSVNDRLDADITVFGARTGGTPAANAAAIQKAIDAAAAQGRGRVVVPAGEWVSGTIWLKSNVELHLAKGAVLLGSDNLDDYNAEDAYPQNGSSPDEGWSGKHLILAVCQTNVAVTGEGVVDGNGTAFLNPTGCKPNPTAVAFRKGYVNIPNRASKKRPGQELAFVECRGVRVKGVTLRNMAMWTTALPFADARGASRTRRGPARTSS